MKVVVEDYLAFRRKLGFVLRREGELLADFARYADGTGHKGPITTELAARWAKLPEKAAPSHWARRYDLVRRFARYRLPLDPSTEVPPRSLLGSSHRRRQPYIYSPAEIADLLGAAAKLAPRNGLRPLSYTTLLGLLATTGLRVSEGLRLTRSDVDLAAGVLTISETKFHKSRLVPLHPSTSTALGRYAQHRDRVHPLARAGTFFVSGRGAPLNYWTVSETFARLRRDLGWAGGGRPSLPRIHDLRHSFACRRLLRWYEEGADVHLNVAALATYLGHAKVTSTYWYLSAIPELMAIACSRFQRRDGER